MYECELKSRRITTYIRQEAYKWLEANINKYEVCKDTEAARLFLEIKKAGVDKEKYDKFVEKVMKDPYIFALYGYKEAKKNFSIITRDVRCLFVSFDGTPLPIGFITQFFEDDYETQEDIDNLVTAALASMREDFKIESEEKNLTKREKMEVLKKQFYYMFDTKPMFHITNGIKMVVTLTIFITCIYFFASNDVIKKFVELIRYGENENFFSTYIVHVLLDTFLIIFLIPKIIHIVETIIFYVVLLYVRLKTLFFTKNSENFVDKTLAPLCEFFNSKGVLMELVQRKYISDNICNNVPSQKKLYMKLNNFNLQSISKKSAGTKNSKHFAHLHIEYNRNNIQESNKIWKKNITFPIIMTIVILFMNVPAMRELAVDLFEFGYEAVMGEEFSPTVEPSVTDLPASSSTPLNTYTNVPK